MAPLTYLSTAVMPHLYFFVFAVDVPIALVDQALLFSLIIAIVRWGDLHQRVTCIHLKIDFTLYDSYY